MIISRNSLYKFTLFVYLTLVFVSVILVQKGIDVSLLKYSSIPLLVLFLVITNNFRVYLNTVYLPFLFLFLLGCLNLFFVGKQGGLELIFIISSVALFLPWMKEKSTFNIDVFFIFSTFLFILLNFKGIQVDFSLSAFVRSETSNLEGGYSFIFGLFFCYFFLSKKYIFSIFCFLLVILTMKRIVFISCVLCVLLSLSPKFIVDFYLKKIFLVLTNVFYLLFSYSFAAGYFDDIIRKVVGINATHFSQGRTSLTSSIIPSLDENLTQLFFLGRGAGTVVDNLTLSFGSYHLLHNDVLKVFYEYGFIAFICFFLLLYSVKSKESLIFALSLNVYFFTDNVLIYTHVLVFYLILALKLRESND